MPRTVEALRAWRATPEGRAKTLEWNRKFYARNPDAVRIRSQHTRAKDVLIEDTANTFDELDWRELLNQYAGRCAYCLSDSDIQIEHKVPLSRGGANTKANIVPACRSCNRSKGTRTPEEWRLSK